MSIIHDALKKVQSKMGGVNPEDIVEVLPSENSSSATPASKAEPKGFSLRSFLIIIFCLILIAGAIFFGLLKYQQKNPEVFLNKNLPNPIQIKNNIEKKITESPVGKMVQPLMPKKATPEPTPLAQIKVPAVVTPPASNPTPPTVSKEEAKTDTTPTQTNSESAPTDAEPTPPTPPPIIVPPTPEIVLNIQGVMASPKGNVALINGNVFGEGEVINGIKLIKIGLQELTVERDGKEQTIPVKK